MNRVLFHLKTWLATLALVFMLISITSPSIAFAAGTSGSGSSSSKECGLSMLGNKSIPEGYQKQILSWVPKDGATNTESAFWVYVQGLHNTIMPYIFFAAIIYVVFSGIQYMLSGYTPGLEKEAKQRIIGVVTGILFYMIMVTLYNWFICDVATI